MLALTKHGLMQPSQNRGLTEPTNRDPAEVYGLMLAAQVKAITEIIVDAEKKTAEIKRDGKLFANERLKKIDEVRTRAIERVNVAVLEGEKNLILDGNAKDIAPDRFKSITSARSVIQYNVARAKKLISGGVSWS